MAATKEKIDEIAERIEGSIKKTGSKEYNVILTGSASSLYNSGMPSSEYTERSDVDLLVLVDKTQQAKAVVTDFDEIKKEFNEIRAKTYATDIEHFHPKKYKGSVGPRGLDYWGEMAPTAQIYGYVHNGVVLRASPGRKELLKGLKAEAWQIPPREGYEISLVASRTSGEGALFEDSYAMLKAQKRYITALNQLLNRGQPPLSYTECVDVSERLLGGAYPHFHHMFADACERRTNNELPYDLEDETVISDLWTFFNEMKRQCIRVAHDMNYAMDSNRLKINEDYVMTTAVDMGEAFKLQKDKIWKKPVAKLLHFWTEDFINYSSGAQNIDVVKPLLTETLKTYRKFGDDIDIAYIILRGKIAALLGEHVPAEKDLTRARDVINDRLKASADDIKEVAYSHIKPDDSLMLADVYYDLGRVHLKNKNISEAESDLERSLEHDPLNSGVWEAMAEVMKEYKRDRKVKECMDIADLVKHQNRHKLPDYLKRNINERAEHLVSLWMKNFIEKLSRGESETLNYIRDAMTSYGHDYNLFKSDLPGMRGATSPTYGKILLSIGRQQKDLLFELLDEHKHLIAELQAVPNTPHLMAGALNRVSDFYFEIRNGRFAEYLELEKYRNAMLKEHGDMARSLRDKLGELYFDERVEDICALGEKSCEFGYIMIARECFDDIEDEKCRAEKTCKRKADGLDCEKYHDEMIKKLEGDLAELLEKYSVLLGAAKNGTEESK